MRKRLSPNDLWDIMSYNYSRVLGEPVLMHVFENPADMEVFAEKLKPIVDNSGDSDDNR